MNDNGIRERQKLSWEGTFYSIRRIDLLIVSICGAGIYLCLETIKYLSDKHQDIHYLIKIAGILFLLGIIINFISQFFGYKANEQDYLMCQAKIDALNRIKKKQKKNKIKKSEKAKIKMYDKKSEKFSNRTKRLNYASMAFMLVGLILIVCYILFTF